MSDEPSITESSSIAGAAEKRSRRGQFSLRWLVVMTALVALVLAHIVTLRKLSVAEQELSRLRREAGYLADSSPTQLAAVRVPSDEPLTYRVRVRVPKTPRYRVAYSSVWPKRAGAPEWFAAVDLPPGESLVTVQVCEDPRDERWKITTIVRSDRGTKRVATSLPPEHVGVFRESHDAVSTGVGRETMLASTKESIRLLDERWLVGEGSLLLYGQRPPERDQIGIYAELQPDDRPL